jgi:hypothetical protein
MLAAQLRISYAKVAEYQRRGDGLRAASVPESMARQFPDNPFGADVN